MRQTAGRWILTLVGVFALYTAAGKLGLQLATVNPSASSVWPPTGIAIAAALIFGYRTWPAIFAGAFVVNITTNGQIPASLGVAVGNTLEGLAGAYLVARFASGRDAFFRPPDVFRFAAGAAVAAPVVSATIGVTTLVITGNAQPQAFAPVWWTWWVGDAAGALIAAPLLILWATPMPAFRGMGDRSELVALAAAAAATILIGFSRLSPLASSMYPMGFLIYPVLVWTAFRFGPRAAATLIALMSAGAVTGTTLGVGSFGERVPGESLPFVQAFVAVASLTSLALAAAVVERQKTAEALRATEERLRIAEEQKVAARDELIQVAAHELRTPLTSLYLAVQHLEREMEKAQPERSSTVSRALAALRPQTERLTALVNQLLDTVRIQTGRTELATSEQDVVAIATRVAAEMQAATSRHEIAVNATAPVRAIVDPIRLEQVMRNLIDNAVKYSPGGRVTVYVTAGDGSVLLSVSDDGPGIALADRDRLFDRFQEPDRKRSGDGLGLGLHVSRQIVELHGGSIAAEFPDGGGTRMVVRLPHKVAPKEADIEEMVP